MGRGCFACVGLLGCALVGCGDPLVRGQLVDLRHRLDEAQASLAGSQKKLDELENRIFLLTDQLESQKVESTHRGTPRLPVITLRPRSDDPSDGAPDRADVQFEGPAESADASRVRPAYRLDGHLGGERITAARSMKTIAPAEVAAAGDSSENLGVAPAPPIRESTSPIHESAAPLPEPLKQYRSAYRELMAGHHDVAVRGFRDFLRHYPHHDYADNAQYWLGECFYDRKRYAEAAPEFRAVVSRYPLGNKAPDALLKLAYCLLAMGRGPEGRDLLQQLATTYPRTEAARLAERRLAIPEPKEGS